MLIDNHPFVLEAISNYLYKVDDFKVVNKITNGNKALAIIIFTSYIL